MHPGCSARCFAPPCRPFKAPLQRNYADSLNETRINMADGHFGVRKIFSLDDRLTDKMNGMFPSVNADIWPPEYA